MTASGGRLRRLPQPAVAIQIDTTPYRSEYRVSHGFQRFDHSFHRTLLICNGYSLPIVVIARSEFGTRSVVTHIPAGKCKIGEIQENRQWNRRDPEYQGEHIFGIVTIVSVDGQILASYSGDATKLIGPGLHFQPQWMVTERGLFAVPPEYEDTWNKDMQAVERLAPHRMRPHSLDQ
jgi:hypothetical protein